MKEIKNKEELEYKLNDVLLGESVDHEGVKYVMIDEEVFGSCISCCFEKEGGVCGFGGVTSCSRLDKVFVEDVPTESNENFFSEVTQSLAKMLEIKNSRYGESALTPLDIFAKHHSYGSRLDEKLARVKNSDELRKNDVADLLGGLILICKDKGWNNFDDQID